MSDVRLSNGSPTLERTEPRVSDHPKPSACKSLFGSVDHEELKRDLKGHLREMEDAASAKWGFDFANHTPLVNGSLQWELVDCRDVPDFYKRSLRREKGVCSTGNNNVDLNGNHSCVVMVAPADDSDRSDGQMEQCTGLRKRPACHDGSAQSKRSHTSSSNSSSSSDELSCPSLSHSAEHTPRKSSPKRLT
ncbi:cyclin-dependent kinase inhibitor 1B [Solea senegalensis]|uniref:Cyclin-dependent kinase inhibitor 1B n=1 Tax=Solea senegalensis TaxID=28829 RepID=A0AAV6SZK2_SOLSE|nr:cyclin-dependent kinase inhibitor 1Bb [Solea senegalensis]KAG7522551.1 cyclin-dependent kinase inhibitor 1B [Solea senegalensis]